MNRFEFKNIKLINSEFRDQSVLRFVKKAKFRAIANKSTQQSIGVKFHSNYTSPFK